jgi:flagellar hook-length control protein FliK
VSQDLLESAADSAMLRTEPDGTTSFDIAFSDELLSDVACRVTVAGGRVVAIFRVKDDNTRRLLEAEAGRLRVRLEERGLRVEEVRVEVES